MAKEYIERDVAIEKTEAFCDVFVTQWTDEKVLAWIRNLPTADVVEVVRGSWVGTADGYADGELVYDMWECSECGYDADGADEKPNWNFCPNCGADMRERRDNNAAD